MFDEGLKHRNRCTYGGKERRNEGAIQGQVDYGGCAQMEKTARKSIYTKY